MCKFLKKKPAELNCGESLGYSLIVGVTVAGGYALCCGAFLGAAWVYGKVKSCIEKAKEESEEELEPMCTEEKEKVKKDDLNELYC